MSFIIALLFPKVISVAQTAQNPENSDFGLGH